MRTELRNDRALSWSAECNLDSGGTEDAPQNFSADHEKGRYYVAVGIRSRNGSIDLSRTRFRARWIINRDKIEVDGRTPTMNLVSLGTHATADEAKKACEDHWRKMIGHNQAAPEDPLNDIPGFLDRTASAS